MSPPVDPAVFDLRIALHRDHVVISVIGELDCATADLLRSAAGEAWQAEPTGIVVDLAAMTFCDSMGIGALIYILKGCNERGVRLALAGLGRTTEYLLRITGLLTCFERYASWEEALSAGGEACGFD